MNCSNCNRCGSDPCGCKGCEPARYSCDFSIQVDPYDPFVWLFDQCGKISKIRIPKIPETCTGLSTDFSSSSLIYDGECGQDIITGTQLGELINLDDLRDVDAKNADSCDLLVFDPGCTACGDACKPKPAMWRKYHIPDAGDCEMEPDDNGYYHVLKKNDCGCIVECRMPVMPSGMTALNYQRDSVPDDPDFPWYYGNYNDKINLHLRENAPKYFGKYALKVTVNYGVQAIKSDKFDGYNWRSIVVPVIEGERINIEMEGSILQNWAVAGMFQGTGRSMPWGTASLRGSLIFIVPKGKEAYLHHEMRVRQMGVNWPDYSKGPWDGQRVPDSEATLNSILHPATRLNGLQVIIEPTQGGTDFDPVKDPYRDQLDPAVDEYPNPYY